MKELNARNLKINIGKNVTVQGRKEISTVIKKLILELIGNTNIGS